MAPPIPRMLVPTSYDDFTAPNLDFSPARLGELNKRGQGDERTARMLFASDRLVYAGEGLSSNGNPIVRIVIADRANHQLEFWAPASERLLLDYCQKRQRKLAEHGQGCFAFFGPLKYHKGKFVVIQPEPVHPSALGRPRPVYPLSTYILKAQLREVDDLDEESYLAAVRAQAAVRAAFNDGAFFQDYVIATSNELFKVHLSNRPTRQAALGEEAGTHLRDSRRFVEELLMRAHSPETWEEALDVQGRIDFIAAVAMMRPTVENSLRKERRNATRYEKRGFDAMVPKLPASAKQDGYGPWIEELTRSLPFKLTEEQRTALSEAFADIDAGQPMHRLLSGDVGTGKTVVYLVLARAMILAGHRVAVLAPTDAVARQIHREFHRLMPDLNAVLHAKGDHPEPGDYPLRVGTTALFGAGCKPVDLMIVDEQHKFSREQRERLMSAHGHLYEGTATCIPRTQALTEFGIMKASYLRKGHVEKSVTTRIWEREDNAALFLDIQRTVALGAQVLVIYPRIDDDSSGDGDEDVTPAQKPRVVRSIKASQDRWEKQFPGRVRYAYSWQDPALNQQAIQDLSNGTADILVSTTYVEVGVNLPNLRRVVVVHAEYFGLNTLHQIRGRAARTGGEGWFDLYLPERADPKAMRRLQVLVDVTDGFRVAELDLELRHAGDISRAGTRQKGRLAKPPFYQHLPPMSLHAKASSALWHFHREALQSSAT